ncbi:hypothetical protein V499_01384 [Pseudogymnoascus sp. VKM F-103]|nr:hypothetical protein V499_01384 [Pseudogymnoascus sp. VKM F-103]
MGKKSNRSYVRAEEDLSALTPKPVIFKRLQLWLGYKTCDGTVMAIIFIITVSWDIHEEIGQQDTRVELWTRLLSKQQPQHRAIADMAGGRVKQKVRVSWVTVCAAIHGPVAYFQRVPHSTPVADQDQGGEGEETPLLVHYWSRRDDTATTRNTLLTTPTHARLSYSPLYTQLHHKILETLTRSSNSVSYFRPGQTPSLLLLVCNASREPSCWYNPSTIGLRVNNPSTNQFHRSRLRIYYKRHLDIFEQVRFRTQKQFLPLVGFFNSHFTL